MKTMLSRVLTVAVAMLAVVGIAAVPQAAHAEDGPVEMWETGHWYQVVDTRMNWDDAVAFARNRSLNGTAGHLTVISSTLENDFIATLTGSFGAWIGGRDIPHANGREFQWVDGPERGQVFTSCVTKQNPADCQSSAFAKWPTFEPNNAHGPDSELCLQFLGDYWNDGNCGVTLPIVIEFEPPVSHDPVRMPGTDHWYQYVPEAVDWDIADSNARSRTFDGMQGHLVTIGTSREADFVSRVSGANNIWLGARAIGVGESRNWTWLFGLDSGRIFTRCGNSEASSCVVPVGSYAPWSTGDPNNSHIEDAAIVANRSWGGGQWPAVMGAWGSCMTVQNCAMDGYVVEYEATRSSQDFTLVPSEFVVAPKAQTSLLFLSAATGASVAVTGSVRATVTADSAGFGNATFTATKAGIQKFTASYSVKVGKTTNKYTATTQLYVPSVSGPMLKIKQGKTGKFSLQFMPPGASVVISLTGGRAINLTADSAGKASTTQVFNTRGAVNYTVTVAGVQVATGGLTIS